jgi:hypothetical protein
LRAEVAHPRVVWPTAVARVGEIDRPRFAQPGLPICVIRLSARGSRFSRLLRFSLRDLGLTVMSHEWVTRYPAAVHDRRRKWQFAKFIRWLHPEQLLKPPMQDYSQRSSSNEFELHVEAMFPPSPNGGGPGARHMSRLLSSLPSAAGSVYRLPRTSKRHPH